MTSCARVPPPPFLSTQELLSSMAETPESQTPQLWLALPASSALEMAPDWPQQRATWEVGSTCSPEASEKVAAIAEHSSCEYLERRGEDHVAMICGWKRSLFEGPDGQHRISLKRLLPAECESESNFESGSKSDRTELVACTLGMVFAQLRHVSWLHRNM